MRIKCRAVAHMSCEWNWKACPSTSGLCGSCGGGKKAFDLKDATSLEQGQANKEPCLLPQRTGRDIWACFVAKSAIEWWPVSVNHSA